MSHVKNVSNINWNLPADVAFEWHEQIDSTSSELMRRAHAHTLAHRTVIAAQAQSAGRGRMGRNWVNAAGDSLMFSIAYAVPAQLPLAGLSLALGVGVAEALNEALQSKAVQLKWPNDFLMADSKDTFKKLGGLLIESVPFNRNRNGALVAERWLIAGLGLNLHMTNLAGDHPLRSEAVALDTVWHRPQAMTLAGIGSLAATACLAALQQFEREGFASALQARWHALHAHQARRVRYTPTQGAVIEGAAMGVDEQGQLMIEAEIADNAGMPTKTIHRINSTEGQLRLC